MRHVLYHLVDESASTVTVVDVVHPARETERARYERVEESERPDRAHGGVVAQPRRLTSRKYREAPVHSSKRSSYGDRWRVFGIVTFLVPLRSSASAILVQHAPSHRHVWPEQCLLARATDSRN